MNVKRAQYLILIRHAHRDTVSRLMDNGLSAKGREQVSLLKKYFKKRWLPHLMEPIHFISSPKKRCLETLEPLALLGGGKLSVSEAVDEHGLTETLADFSARIEKFKAMISEKEGSYVVCSHGDWIPHFLEVSIGHPLTIKKSGVFVLKCMGNGQFKLVEMVSRLQ